MTWTLLVLLVAGLGAALLAACLRRHEVEETRALVEERDELKRQGVDEAQLQHPVIDLSRCLGCGTCVDVCPEDGVLALVHGQAQVVHGARCVGVSACERNCPVDAIKVTLARPEARNDIPVITESLQAAGVEGLFLAGEVTAHALIKTAVEHGTRVAREAATRCPAPVAVPAGIDAPPEPNPRDLVIVGAGPAGLACALEARRLGLDFVVLEKEPTLGGTVASYPRRKLVLTEPVELPLGGRLSRDSYTKEDLMELWSGLADAHDLPIEHGVEFRGLCETDDGHLEIRTDTGTVVTRNACLALGRRGVPRKLSVPGEDLPKVAYALLDASSYAGRRVLVVGGGDSAVEAALALGTQAGTEVTLSYRKERFFRIRARNAERLAELERKGKIRVLTGSEVCAIRETEVDLDVLTPSGIEKQTLANDEVFAFVGGVPPVDLLSRSGVNFDESDLSEEERNNTLAAQTATATIERGTGLRGALIAAFGLAAATLMFAVWHADYYSAVAEVRPTMEKHNLLRPGRSLGLFFGIVATVLVVINLLYLLRRSPKVRFNLGSLSGWMTSHVTTGVLALLCAMLHAAMRPADTPGGHAFWALAILAITGAIGRYFYAYVPRAVNGRELALDEAQSRLDSFTSVGHQDDHLRGFHQRVRDIVDDYVASGRWNTSFFGRVFALVGGQIGFRRQLSELRRAAGAEGLDPRRTRQILDEARTIHRAALMVGHFDDLRSILNTWRYLHRWVTALMLLLLVVHVVHALSFGAAFGGRGQ